MQVPQQTPVFVGKIEQHDRDTFKLLDTEGNSIDAKSLTEWTPVLVTSAGNIDPFYLQVVKEGTVTLILNQTSGDVTPPVSVY